MPESTLGRTIFQHVISAVFTAVLLATLALVWDRVRAGGLVEALGGVSQSELKSIPPFPQGAVVAFDQPKGCPDGWSRLSAAEGRTIVGASLESEEFHYNKREGKRRILLTQDHLPQHEHPFLDVYYSEYEPHMPNGAISVEVPGMLGANGMDPDNVGWAIESMTDAVGPDEQKDFTNLQPYLALYYCRLD